MCNNLHTTPHSSLNIRRTAAWLPLWTDYHCFTSLMQKWNAKQTMKNFFEIRAQCWNVNLSCLEAHWLIPPVRTSYNSFSAIEDIFQHSCFSMLHRSFTDALSILCHITKWLGAKRKKRGKILWKDVENSS